MTKVESEQCKSRLCKIVYFDEESVTDYIQIVEGGNLEKTTELLNETTKKGQAEINAKASGGIGGVLKALVGFETKVSVDILVKDADFEKSLAVLLNAGYTVI